jgi:hypothetical protein
MHRRALLTVSVVTASGLAVRVAAAATEGPFGTTATPVPVPPGQRLPLGPLSIRYPDAHVESLYKRFKASVGCHGATMAGDTDYFFRPQIPATSELCEEPFPSESTGSSRPQPWACLLRALAELFEKHHIS